MKENEKSTVVVACTASELNPGTVVVVNEFRGNSTSKVSSGDNDNIICFLLLLSYFVCTGILLIIKITISSNLIGP